MIKKQTNIKSIYTQKETMIGMLYVLLGHLLAVPLILTLIGVTHSATLNFFNGLITVIVLIVISRRVLKDDISRLIKNIKTLLWIIPALYVVQFVGRMIVGILMMIIHGEMDLGGNQEAVELILEQFPALMVISAVVFAPIWEEIFFTGLIFGNIRKKNRLLAYIVASLSFGLLHTIFFFILDFSPTLFLVTLIYVPLSVVCCYIYEKTDSLYSPILLHSFANLIATLLLLAS